MARLVVLLFLCLQVTTLLIDNVHSNDLGPWSKGNSTHMPQTFRKLQSMIAKIPGFTQHDLDVIRDALNICMPMKAESLQGYLDNIDKAIQIGRGRIDNACADLITDMGKDYTLVKWTEDSLKDKSIRPTLLGIQIVQEISQTASTILSYYKNEVARRKKLEKEKKAKKGLSNSHSNTKNGPSNPTENGERTKKVKGKKGKTVEH